MMKRAWQGLHLAVVWLLVACAFFALARIWAALMRSDNSAKDFWDVATAVGTCGAAIVAVWIALRQEHLRRIEAADRARLTSAHLVPRLSSALDAANKTLAILGTPRRELPDYAKYQRLRSARQHMSWRIPQEELIALTSISGGVGVRLARAMALLNSVADDVLAKEGIFGASIVVLGRHAEQGTVYDSWSAQLTEGAALLADSIAKLNVLGGNLAVLKN